MREVTAGNAGPGDARLRELVAYWDRLRDGRTAPPRAALDPAAMQALLPWVTLLDVQEGASAFQLRLAGTAVEGLCGRSLTGLVLAPPLPPAIDPDLLDWLRHACATKAPLSLQAVLTTRRGQSRLLAVILPLSSDGDRIDKLLCGCVGAGAPPVSPGLPRHQDPVLALSNVTAVALTL